MEFFDTNFHRLRSRMWRDRHTVLMIHLIITSRHRGQCRLELLHPLARLLRDHHHCAHTSPQSDEAV